MICRLTPPFSKLLQFNTKQVFRSIHCVIAKHYGEVPPDLSGNVTQEIRQAWQWLDSRSTVCPRAVASRWSHILTHLSWRIPPLEVAPLVSRCGTTDFGGGSAKDAADGRGALRCLHLLVLFVGGKLGAAHDVSDSEARWLIMLCRHLFKFVLAAFMAVSLCHDGVGCVEWACRIHVGDEATWLGAVNFFFTVFGIRVSWRRIGSSSTVLYLSSLRVDKGGRPEGKLFFFLFGFKCWW